MLLTLAVFLLPFACVDLVVSQREIDSTDSFDSIEFTGAHDGMMNRKDAAAAKDPWRPQSLDLKDAHSSIAHIFLNIKNAS